MKGREKVLLRLSIGFSRTREIFILPRRRTRKRQTERDNMARGETTQKVGGLKIKKKERDEKNKEKRERC